MTVKGGGEHQRIKASFWGERGFSKKNNMRDIKPSVGRDRSVSAKTKSILCNPWNIEFTGVKETRGYWGGTY